MLHHHHYHQKRVQAKGDHQLPNLRTTRTYKLKTGKVAAWSQKLWLPTVTDSAATSYTPPYYETHGFRQQSKLSQDILAINLHRMLYPHFGTGDINEVGYK